jgi:hypothetical protein
MPSAARLSILRGSRNQGGGTNVAPWTSANVPWALQSGESVDDDRPPGVAVINYDSYSNGGTRSFGQTLAAIRSAANAPYYVRMGPGTYHITDFSFAAGSGQGRGYQDINATKYFAGLIGAGADQTFVVVDPDIMSDEQLAGVSSVSAVAVQVMAIYAGGTNLTVPMFFSGITFRGNFQQEIPLEGLTGTAPAPYVGLYLVSVKPGTMVQFCRFQGFGFTAKASPPYELGAIQSVRSSWTLYRTEIDGRLAPQVNAATPVSSGGLMWNYEEDVKAIDSWLHHTRRSGWATHDHAPSEGGNGADNGAYYARNFQVERIADTPDSYAGTALSFNSANVEEVRRTFTVVRPRLTVTNGTHVTLGYSNGNSMADAISITDPIIGNTQYNGCIVFGIVKTPNSYGDNPYYTAYLANGLGSLPISVTNNNVDLTPVLNTSYNAAVHTPSQYYIVKIV